MGTRVLAGIVLKGNKLNHFLEVLEC